MPDRHGSIYMYRVVLYEKYVLRQRPYYDEYTRSHQNSEVKHRKARSVLGWGTAWEALRVPLAFLILFEKRDHAEGHATGAPYPLRARLSVL